MAFNNKIKLECILCNEVNEDNWQKKEDDLLVCTNDSCSKRNKIICRGCMTTVHRKKGDHSNDYVDADSWWKQYLQIDPTAKLEMIHDNTPQLLSNKSKGLTKGLVSIANGMTIAVKNGGYATYTKQTLNALQAMKNPTTKQLQEGLKKILGQLGKSSKETTKIIEKASKNGGLEGLWDSLKGYSKEASLGVVTVKEMAKGQAVVNFAMCALEIGYVAVQYHYYGSISEDEYLRRKNKAVTANVAAFGGGVAIGALIGAVFGPAGIVFGSAIGSYVADYCARDWFDDYWPDKSQQFIEAMKTFNFPFQSLHQVTKSDTFNLKVVRKRYHELSKYHNPNGEFMISRNDISDKEKQDDWNNFYDKYILLLTIAKQKEDKKK